jgi:TM2 domain-containing membrane protein YozV
MAYQPPPGPGGYGGPPGGYGPPGGGGYGPPPAGSYGYGVNPYAAPAYDAQLVVARSEKSRSTALLLAYLPGLFGIFGIDRFYRGQVLLGILKLISCGGIGIWALVDLILLALGEAKDSEGKLLNMPSEVVGTPTVNGNHVLLAGILAGSLGVDRFMLGHTGLGILKLLTCGGFGIWHFVDVILVANGSLRDAQGNSLRWA